MPDQDRTEDLRSGQRNAPGGAGTPAEGLNPQPLKEEDSMPTVTPPADMPVPAAVQCRHCSVPTAGSDVCSFCANYTPPETPAQQLDVLVNRLALIQSDGGEVLRALAAGAPLSSVVDLVRALGHLRQAAVLPDKVNDQLEAVQQR